MASRTPLSGLANMPLPAYDGMGTASSLPRPISATAQPAAFDPSGIVPVARTQPMVNDGFEAQRLMENRLGSMPPSSFSGAGAGFVPLDRAPPVVGNPATMATDMSNVRPMSMTSAASPAPAMPQLPTQATASMSPTAARRLAVAQALGAPGQRKNVMRPPGRNMTPGIPRRLGAPGAMPMGGRPEGMGGRPEGLLGLRRDPFIR